MFAKEGGLSSPITLVSLYLNEEEQLKPQVILNHTGIVSSNGNFWH